MTGWHTDTRRNIVGWAAIVWLIAASTSSCGTWASPDSRGRANEDLVKVDICTSATSATQALPVYAQDSGLFRRYGLDVSVTVVAGGSRAVSALISGSTQLCLIAGGPAANAVLAGANLVVVGSLLDTYGYSLVVSKDVHTPADLKGRAVAVSAPGTASAVATDIALERLGLQPGRDVSILSIGDYGQRLAALEAGYVAGTLLVPPELEFARARGLETLLDLAPLRLPTLQSAIVTNRTFLNEHRPTVLRFVQALAHAMSAVKTDRGGAIAALAKYAGLDPKTHVSALEKTYEVVLRQLKDTPAVPLEAIRATIAEAAKNHPNASELRPEVFVDMTVVEELARSGFFKALD